VRETRSLVHRACLGPRLHYESRLDEEVKDVFSSTESCVSMKIRSNWDGQRNTLVHCNGIESGQIDRTYNFGHIWKSTIWYKATGSSESRYMTGKLIQSGTILAFDYTFALSITQC
jgi:hypothetical protein